MNINLRVFAFLMILLAPCSLADVPGHPRLLFSASQADSIRIRALTSGTTENKFFLEIKQNADHFMTFPTEMYQINQLISVSMRQYNLFSVAFTFFVTGDTTYLAGVRGLIFGPGGTGGLLGYPYEGRNAGIVTGLSQTVDLLWDNFNIGERTQILQKVLDHLQSPSHPGEGLREYFSNPNTIHDNNHLGTFAVGLLSAAIVFWGDSSYPEASSDIDAVRYRTLTYQNNLVFRMHHADGCPTEGVYYGTFSYATILSMMHMLGRWDGIDYLHQSEFSSRLDTGGAYFCYEVLPAPRDNLSRYFNSVNSSFKGFYNTNGHLAGMHLHSSIYSNGLSKWVFNNTVEDPSNLVNVRLDHPPTQNASKAYWFVEALALNNNTAVVDPSTVLPKSRYFPERGLVYIRSSDNWADNHDIQFSLTASRAIDPVLNVFSVKHDQPDKNSITLSAFGQDFITDIGYEGKWPKDQNYVLIDGKGEAIGTYFDTRSQSWLPDWLEREGNLIMHRGGDLFDFIHADAKAAFARLYGSAGNGLPDIVDNYGHPYFQQTRPGAYLNPVEKADRYVLSCRASNGLHHVFVVCDDIQKDLNWREYTWVFNTIVNVPNTYPLVINSGGKSLKIWYSLQGIPQFNSLVKTIVPSQSPLDLGGSPIPTSEYQVQQNEIISTSSVNPYFHIVMIPYETDEQNPIVTNPPVSSGSCFKLAWNTDYEDFSIFKFASNVTSEFVSTDAKLTQIRKQASTGLPILFAMAEGSQLAFDGRELVNLYGVQGTVMREGDSILLSGDINYFRVYAPSATSVMLNDNSIDFVQVGDYVESPNVTVNRTWSGSIASSSSITVAANVVLEITAGSTLSFAPDKSLIVDGSLVADGSEAAIILTRTGSSGYWGGIYAAGIPATPSITLTNVTIEHASIAVNAGTHTALSMNTCFINDANVGVQVLPTSDDEEVHKDILSSEFTEIRTIGLYIEDFSDLNLEGTSIISAGLPIQTFGIFLRNSSPKVFHNKMEGFTTGLHCELASYPELQNGDEGGYNRIRYNEIGVRAFAGASPMLGLAGVLPGGMNSIFDNTAWDVVLNKGCTVWAEGNWWGTIEDPKAQFSITDVCRLFYDGWLDYDPNGDNMNIVGRPGDSGKGGEEIQQGLLPPIVRQVIEARLKRRYGEAMTLLRSILANTSMPMEAKRWAVNQMLGVAQMMPAPALSSYVVNQLGGNPVFSRELRGILPGSYIHERSLVNAMAAYDQNIQRYPNSELERDGLYGKLLYELYNQQNLEHAQQLYNALHARYPDDSETILAEIQLQNYNHRAMGRVSSRNLGLNNSVVQSSIRKQLPAVFALHPNYPNPFNPSTQINYDLPDAGNVSMVVYDVLGRKVADLVSSHQEAGYHSVTWNATTQASGVYFVRFEVTSPGGNQFYAKTNKLILMK